MCLPGQNIWLKGQKSVEIMMLPTMFKVSHQCTCYYYCNKTSLNTLAGDVCDGDKKQPDSSERQADIQGMSSLNDVKSRKIEQLGVL